MSNSQVTITAYSTALFSTWIFIEEYGLLFDAGDGVTAGLLQKSHKIKHAFITHPDRDHIMGLFQLNQLNARPGYPRIYYPEDSGSFSAMRDFHCLFDGQVKDTKWIPTKDGSRIVLNKQLVVDAFRNEHMPTSSDVSKSLSYQLIGVKSKLKEKYKSLTGLEIKEHVEAHGQETLTDVHETKLISFSGDTPVGHAEKWDGSEILIHEATFLKSETGAQINSKFNKHSRLDDVLKMVSELSIGKLILTHFSSRYSEEEINRSVQKYCDEFNIDIPVYVVYPGKISRDLLNGDPINS